MFYSRPKRTHRGQCIQTALAFFHFMTYLLIFLVYGLGSFLAFQMLVTEHKAEGNEQTIGSRAATILLSLLSWLVILQLLIMAWVKSIGNTGYWQRPLKAEVNNDTKTAKQTA